ncbi:hypothetical protein PIB30_078757, partial [Stylosanthes scabra]|nr:hypothetical protein [Stylosanthes scabra]
SSNVVINLETRDLQSKILEVMHRNWTALVHLIQLEANYVRGWLYGERCSEESAMLY